MMVSELEVVALALFAERGFSAVTVEEIAGASGISARTFYRYFATKEDVLQLRIDLRSSRLSAALAARPLVEPPLRSVRHAMEEAIAAEDEDLLRIWTTVVSATPSVLRAVVGGIQLKTHAVLAEFLGSRLGQAASALVPTTLAAAMGGVIQAVQTRWFLVGGDLATMVSEGLEVLEGAMGRP
jgi:AcrR family transcriptional regulator